MLNNHHIDIKNSSKKENNFDRSALQPIFILYSAGTSTVALLVTLMVLVNTWKLTKISQNQIALVQLENGKSIIAHQADSYERDPKLIKNYAKQVLSLLFTWNSNISNSESKDPGIRLSNGEKVTTGTWEASFAISEKFRVPFLKGVAKLTPDEIFSGKAQSVLTFEHISNPTTIDRGKWKLSIVANLLIITASHPEGIILPFNKTIIVEAIEVSTDPLPSETSAIQKAVYQLKEKGLQITEIRDLDLDLK